MKNRNPYIKIFKRLLKRNGCFGKFKKYFKAEENYMWRIDRLDKDILSLACFLNNFEADEYVFCAFCWEHTDGKYHFWDNINHEWRKEINQHQPPHR